MNYNFSKDYDKIVKKNHAAELDFLRKRVAKMVLSLPEKYAHNLHRIFPKDPMKLGRKDLLNIGGLVERTLNDIDPLMLKAVEAGYENI